MTSSPAVGPKGTVYVGSFDGALHALDPETGAGGACRPPTTTSTPRRPSARAASTSPRPTARSTPSTSAACCAGAMTPATRSAPRPCSAGRRATAGASSTSARPTTRSYALDSRTESPPRWSFDTTPRDPVLADTATTSTAPLRSAGAASTSAASTGGSCSSPTTGACRKDPRCNRDRAAPSAERSPAWPYVRPTSLLTLSGPPGPLPAATAITTRLIVRQLGITVDAGLTRPTTVIADPPFDFTAQPSGDRHFLHIVPTGFLPPESHVPAAHPGRLVSDSQSAPRSTTRSASAPRCPRSARRRHRRLRRLDRLAVPLPPILKPQPDRLRLLRHGGRRVEGGGGVLLWAVSAKGSLVDRKGAFAFPLGAESRRLAVALPARAQPHLLVRRRAASALRPARRARRRPPRPRLQPDRRGVLPRRSRLRLALVAIGLCNSDAILPSSGTFITGPYRGPANKRPRGVRLASLQLDRDAHEVVAELAGTPLQADRHAAAILLTDASSEAVVSLDYRKRISVKVRRGAIREGEAAHPRGYDSSRTHQGLRDYRCLPAGRTRTVIHVRPH